jgi:hypothetical protein
LEHRRVGAETRRTAALVSAAFVFTDSMPSQVNVETRTSKSRNKNEWCYSRQLRLLRGIIER